MIKLFRKVTSILGILPLRMKIPFFLLKMFIFCCDVYTLNMTYVYSDLTLNHLGVVTGVYFKNIEKIEEYSYQSKC